jgi:two-component system sensor histidine kinase YesM
MRKILGNTKFKTKIVLLFILLLLVNSTFAGMLYYNYAYKDTLKNFYQSSEDIVSQMNVHIHSRLRGITSRVYALNNNMNFIKPMTDFLISPVNHNYVILLSTVPDSISELQNSDDYIDSVYIFTKYGYFENFVKIRRHNVSMEDTPLYQYFIDHPDSTIGWFPAMESPIFQDKETIIPVVYRFKISYQNIFTVVSINQSKIMEYLEKTYGSYDKIFIVDKDGNNIANYSEEEKEVYSALDFEALEENHDVLCEPITYQNNKYLATYTVMKGNGWRICALKSAKSLLGSLSQLRLYILYVLGGSFLLCFITVVILAGMLTKPLGQLVQIMDKTIKKGFHVQFIYPYEDEVGNLAKSYNYMVKEIDTLVTELNENIEELEKEKENVKKVQALKRKAELRALQAQINPHFLYNTLNTITWQAADQGASEISVLSNSLGKFFRVSLSKGKEVITIQEEMEHVCSYLEIQKIRYKSKIHYEISIPEEIRRMSVVKLVLQPLVENSLYHGIKMKENQGCIRISAVLQEDGFGVPSIKICVEDDGLGIGKERLEQLNEGLSQCITDSNSGYGIYNVNERLKLYYGEAYGLTLESKSGEGTRAIIIIPAQDMGGEG